MSAFIILIVCSIIVAVGFLWIFLILVSDGQYDDIYTPSVRMLFEDELRKQDPDNKDHSTESIKSDADNCE